MEQNYHYYAFISYNHRDEKVAKWLQSRLEHYKLPAVARKEIGEDVKIRPVFRYVSDLGVAVLREKIKQELESSKYLIVICSPHSAKPNVKGEHWVNDEVKRFCEMGRKDRIIPVIVDGVPGDAERECFCPALNEIEIAGVDFQKEKKSVGIQKIVAKLLGLRPDILIQRYLEEKKNRARRVFFGFLPILAILAFGGLFAWDAVQTYECFYANYVDSFGLPRGIDRLNADELVGRHVHYRFEYRGYGWGRPIHEDSSGFSLFRCLGFYRVLRRVVQAHSSGVPIEWGHTEYSYRPPIQEFFYEKDWPNVGKRLKKIFYRKKTGAFIKRLELGDGKNGTLNGLLKFYGMETCDAEPLAMESDRTTKLASDIGLRNRAEITQHALERDAGGGITRVLFMNTYGQEVPDGDGIYGYEYKLDDKGRRIEQWYLGLTADGKVGRVVNKIGVGGKFYTYRGRNMSEARYVDDTGRPVAGPHGWMVCVGEFDERDNNTRSTFYNEKGNITLATSGIAGYTATYDNCGNNTVQTYFGVDGKPTLHKDGYAEVRIEYDERGRETRGVWLGVDGKPTLHKDGYAEVRMEYDERGNITRISYFGADGKPMLHQLGIAGYLAQYDERGNRTRESYFGADGKPVKSVQGYAELHIEYDTRGNRTKESCFDENGRPVVSAKGFSVGCAEYDNRGNIIKESYFGADGKPMLHQLGIAGYLAQYDERGNRTRESYFGADGKPVKSVQGYAELHIEYDTRGNRTKESYFDENGRPVVSAKGFSVGCAEYDNRGNIIKESYFGADGKPMLHQLGIAGYLAQYDERGNRTRESYFGADGKPVKSVQGYAELHIEYDTRGNRTKESYFDENGLPVVGGNGFSVVCAEYDALGNKTKVSYFGVDGKPTLHKDGYAGYMSDGTTSNAKYFDISGKAITVRQVVVSDEIVPNLAADKLGVQKGDVWCRLGSYDILKSESVYDVIAPMRASRNEEKELVVARKVGEGYEIRVFSFHVGLMGIGIDSKNISDFDVLEKSYRAYCENEKRMKQ